MTIYLVVPLDHETSEALDRLVSRSPGRTREDLGSEGVASLVQTRADARKRLAESGFLFERRNRAR